MGWSDAYFYVALGLFAPGTGHLPYGEVVSHWFDKHRGLALGLMMFGLGTGAMIMPSYVAYGLALPKNSSQERGYIDIHYNSSLQRYVMIISNDTTFYYAESIDALNWTTLAVLGTFDTVAAYPTAVGLGDDPRILGKSYYVYFTHLPTDGTGWTNGELRRLTVSCQ